MVQAGATIVLQSFFCAIDFTFNSHQRQSFPLCALCKAVYYSHSTRYVSFRLDFRFVFVFFLLLFEMLSGWARGDNDNVLCDGCQCLSFFLCEKGTVFDSLNITFLKFTLFYLKKKCDLTME